MKRTNVKYLLVGLFIGLLVSTIAGTAIYFSERSLNCVEYANYNTLDYKCEIIDAYEKYYNETESILDTLDTKHDWVNKYNFQEYYVSKERLDSLYNLED